jgi:AraC-like DNA-binding protein
MSKALPFEIPKTDPWSFRVQEDLQSVLYPHLHVHPEIQIMWMAKGRGNWFVAEAFGSYEEGNFFVIGSNVPHVFKSEFDPKSKAHALSVFFKPDVFGPQFFALPEMEALDKLWQQATQGIRMNGLVGVAGLFQQLKKSSGPLRMRLLMELFEMLVQGEVEILSPEARAMRSQVAEGERLDRVLTYITEHYSSQISLSEVAEIAYMTPSSFCRYFKNRTRKTLIQFVNDVRVQEVRRQLLQTEKPVSEIAEACGFQNLSHFNKVFRVQSKMSPLLYRQAYQHAF